MNLKENSMAILNYEKFEQMPIVSFGYWNETLDKWADEGHVSKALANEYAKSGAFSDADFEIAKKLGFDFSWSCALGGSFDLFPSFETEVLKMESDGSKILRDPSGLIVKEKPGIVSIPSEIGTSLTDRDAWEKLYLPKLQWTEDRIDANWKKSIERIDNLGIPVGFYAGSFIGIVRNMLGVENLSYLYADDEDLYIEVINTISDLTFKCTKHLLESGAKFDFAQYWEDICFKNGPLVTPTVFKEIVAPQYKRTTDLFKQYGINIVAVDCDGLIDSLIPMWLENGVNTMFPIEVGTWNASIGPWREKYGKEIRGIGGMNKNAFSKDIKAVDDEIERLKPLIAMGGFIPCPDHLIAPDAKFELVQYYCDKMRKLII
jgi:hypothetical protein